MNQIGQGLACVTVILVSILAAGPGLAGASSGCPSNPGGSPQAIASGTEQLRTNDAFFDRYDFAVIGTVTQVDYVEEGSDAEHGVTTIALDVMAVLGDAPAPPTIVLSSPGPDWAAHYQREYFIPVQVEGPNGHPNATFVCDPIAEVDEGVVDELRVLAEESGIEFSMPSAAQPGSDSMAAIVLVVGLGLATAGTGVFIVRYYLRRRPVASGP